MNPLTTSDFVQAGTGIVEPIALEMSKQTNAPLEETRKKIWLVDSLRDSSLNPARSHFNTSSKPWAHEHEPINNLLDAVQDFMGPPGGAEQGPYKLGKGNSPQEAPPWEQGEGPT